MERLMRLLIATLLRRQVTAVERLRQKHDQALVVGNEEQADACRVAINKRKEAILGGLALLEPERREGNGDVVNGVGAPLSGKPR